MRRGHFLLLPIAMILVTLDLPRIARAQDEAELEKEQPAEAELDFQMTDEQFEQWIFGKRIEPARRLYESWLVKEIDRVDRRYWLTSVQKKKLEVAGRGDMKRLFDRFQEAKEQLHRAGGNFNQIGPILQELQSFQQAPHVYL